MSISFRENTAVFLRRLRLLAFTCPPPDNASFRHVIPKLWTLDVE